MQAVTRHLNLLARRQVIIDDTNQRTKQDRVVGTDMGLGSITQMDIDAPRNRDIAVQPNVGLAVGRLHGEILVHIRRRKKHPKPGADFQPFDFRRPIAVVDHHAFFDVKTAVTGRFLQKPFDIIRHGS